MLYLTDQGGQVTLTVRFQAEETSAVVQRSSSTQTHRRSSLPFILPSWRCFALHEVVLVPQTPKPVISCFCLSVTDLADTCRKLLSSMLVCLLTFLWESNWDQHRTCRTNWCVVLLIFLRLCCGHVTVSFPSRHSASTGEIELSLIWSW